MSYAITDNFHVTHYITRVFTPTSLLVYSEDFKEFDWLVLYNESKFNILDPKIRYIKSSLYQELTVHTLLIKNPYFLLFF